MTDDDSRQNGDDDGESPDDHERVGNGESPDDHEEASDDPHDRVGEAPGDDADATDGEQSDAADGDGTDWLSSLLSALETLEQRGSASGRRTSDRTVLDYDISIRSGEDVLNGDSRFEGDPFSEEFAGRSSGPDPGRGRPRTRRRRSSHPSQSSHLTTRQYEDELLVTADVSGTEADDVTVGFDDSTLVVAVSGRELDRVEVPWPDMNAEAAIKNGVLTVVIEPDSSDDSTTEGDDEQ
ncbi:Hsp20/alpha crystallin family protein [Natronobacterium texcoconense]|uniref:GvpH protein n=1 Tax=Natronobacterium texcoconense TaxID=1095778 RepID=A0A1H1G8F9_NATTX|nr:Hsp20/alpha crystallin family protein [Natronobacterium texcoconense]SDR09532.1 hypothetical protein SAMN04489842_2314 [Natronobacterium texcoconense]